MGYVYDFDLGSILFFGLTIFFYLYQKRLRNLQDRIFTAMLICAMVAVVFDFAAALMEDHAMACPVWSLYAANTLFIFGMQTCLPLFFLYAVAAAGRFNRFSRKSAVAFALPYAATMALLFLSPWSAAGIFRIDEAHIYQHSLTYLMLYINMGFYVIAGVWVLLRHGRSIQRTQRNVILLFVVILFTATVLQLRLHRYLLTASATALALTSVFYVLQSPLDQVNPLTGAFSRTLLPALLQDRCERGRPYTLLLFSLRSFEEFTRLYGYAAGDALLRDYAAGLIERFRDDIVVYMDTSEFTVLRAGLLSRAELEELYAQTPVSILSGEREVSLRVRLGAIPHTNNESAAAELSLGDFMLRQMRLPGDAPLFVDEDYKRTCAATLRLEATLSGFLAEENMPLALLPIRDAAGTVVAEEARVVLPDKTARYISYGRFLQAIAQSGHAGEYYRAMLRALAPRRARFSPSQRLCLPLLSAVYMQADAAEKLCALFASAGFAPAQILLAVEESEIASAAALSESIRGLAQSGFTILVDSFAEGYTDMSLLSALPIRFARLHEGLIESAASNARTALLLKGLVEILADVGVSTVYSGPAVGEGDTAC